MLHGMLHGMLPESWNYYAPRYYSSPTHVITQIPVHSPTHGIVHPSAHVITYAPTHPSAQTITPVLTYAPVHEITHPQLILSLIPNSGPDSWTYLDPSSSLSSYYRSGLNSCHHSSSGLWNHLFPQLRSRFMELLIP